MAVISGKIGTVVYSVRKIRNVVLFLFKLGREYAADIFLGISSLAAASIPVLCCGMLALI